jgi:hypothetical protein
MFVAHTRHEFSLLALAGFVQASVVGGLLTARPAPDLREVDADCSAFAGWI